MKTDSPTKPERELTAGAAVGWSEWLDEVALETAEKAFEKIGNQIGGIDATPTPVGRAGSLPGQAQAGSPTSSNKQI